MPNFIIKTSWVNKKRTVGLREYYDKVNALCKKNNGLEFLGFYRPLNEGWNWAYFIKSNDIDVWRDFNNEINREYLDTEDNVTKISSSVYQAPDQLRAPPIPKKKVSFNYLFEDKMVWQGISIGINDYYSAMCDALEEIDDMRLLGLYMPWNDVYNYSLFHTFNYFNQLINLMRTVFLEHGRPENMRSQVFGMYERYIVQT